MSRFLLPRSQSPTPSVLAPSSPEWTDDRDYCLSALAAIRKFENLVEIGGMTLCGAVFRERLLSAFAVVVDQTQDFTDSAYTSHENREKILLICDRLKMELDQLLTIGAYLDEAGLTTPTEDFDVAHVQTIRAINELKHQLNITALIQSEELFKLSDPVDLLNRLKAHCLSSDCQRLEEYLEIYNEHAEHVQEVCKLLFHISPTKDLQNMAKSNETSLSLYCPQLISACQGLCYHPSSRNAQIKLEALFELWLSLFGDVHSMSCEVKERIKASAWSMSPTSIRRNRYPSILPTATGGTTTVSSATVPTNLPPPPGPPVSPFAPGKRVTIADESIVDSVILPESTLPPQAPTQGVGSLVGKSTGEIGVDVDDEESRLAQCATEEVIGHTRWPDSKDNDIVKRAKHMSVMALSMFQFTRGEGTLKTTQDLFTQAEFFAEEANKFYKVVRHFTYQVPSGIHKKELLEHLDKVPTFVQQLQFAVKNSTVGKAATFNKVDNVIQEVKNLMGYVAKTVDSCLICSVKYNLDMVSRVRSRTLSPSGRHGEDGEGGMGSRGGTSSSDNDL